MIHVSLCMSYVLHVCVFTNLCVAVSTHLYICKWRDRKSCSTEPELSALWCSSCLFVSRCWGSEVLHTPCKCSTSEPCLPPHSGQGSLGHFLNFTLFLSNVTRVIMALSSGLEIKIRSVPCVCGTVWGGSGRLGGLGLLPLTVPWAQGWVRNCRPGWFLGSAPSSFICWELFPVRSLFSKQPMRIGEDTLQRLKGL